MSPVLASPLTPPPYTEYFNAVNPLAKVLGDPAVVQPQTATVFQPALNLRVQYRSSGLVPTTAQLANMSVYMTLQQPSGEVCSDPDVGVRRQMALKDWPTTLWGSIPTPATNYVSQPGTAFDPGLPFGIYDVCLQDLNGTDKWHKTTYDNTSPDGRTTVLAIPTTNSTSSSTWSTTAC